MATHLMRSVQNKKIRCKNRRATQTVTIHSRYDHASSFTLNLLILKIKCSPNKNRKSKLKESNTAPALDASCHKAGSNMNSYQVFS